MHSMTGMVTPCVGVWIEMDNKVAEVVALGSLPAWECGLKFCCRGRCCGFCCVTPCVGVWIEIGDGKHQGVLHEVTPCVGVWIEIVVDQKYYFLTQSHSLRGSVD